MSLLQKFFPKVKADEPEEEEEDLVDPQTVLKVSEILSMPNP